MLELLERSRALGYLGKGPVDAHVRNADAFAKAVSASPDRAVDLGSGGGVPGLLLALRWPGSSWALIDSAQRRCAFLLDAVDELRLTDRVEVRHLRAEEAGRDEGLRAAADLVTARSFGAPAVTAECGAPLLKVGGVLLVSDPPIDEPELPTRWDEGGLRELSLSDEGALASPGGTIRRLRLTSECSIRYPRRTGIPSKRPLW